MRSPRVIFLVALLLHGRLFGQEPCELPEPNAAADSPVGDLLPGDPAPPLEIGEWVRGLPLDRLVPGAPVIVEFWKLGCPACEASMPLLARLEAEHASKGVLVIAVNVWDAPQSVRAAVESRPDQFPGRVATAEDRVMGARWLGDAHVRTVPAAYVLDAKLRYVWNGDPRARLEKVLLEVIAGTWKTEPERERVVLRNRNDAKAAEHLRRAGKATRSGDTATAIAALDAVLAIDPERYGDNAAQRFRLTMIDKQDPAAAYAFLREHMRVCLWQSSRALSTLARMILSDPAIATRDTELARELAERASELADGKDAMILDLLARANHDCGDLDQAIATQETALARAGATLKRLLEEHLQEYRSERK